MAKDRYQRALSYSLRLIKSRLRSVDELRKKLELRKYPLNTIDKIIQEFVDTGLLDDKQFARAWVEDRLNLNPKSPELLRLELKQKGISQETIEEVLNNIDQRYNFKEIAFNLAKNRYQLLRNVKDSQKKKKRIFDYLRRRGFNLNIIYEALSKIFKKNEN